MNVRTIQLEEASQFEQIGMAVNSKKLNLHQWLDMGRTRLEWCFVIEIEGKFQGRIIYGIFDVHPCDLKIWQMKIADSVNNFLEVGNKLLTDSIEVLKLKGFKTVEYHLYSTASYIIEIYQSLFRELGFCIMQEKESFEANQIRCVETSNRLHYKTLQEVGEKMFIGAIEIVTEGTLDREDLTSVISHGSQQAAILYFELLKEIDFNETWWRMAYDKEGEFVGLVVPQKLSVHRGAINYIGVTPVQRGRGYVNDLLWEGSRLMIEEGIENLIADIDVQNYPLKKALELLGYQFECSQVVLKLDL
ncbi:GNAT family N-acetyltransferase [Lacrimispora aerotolerans]|uniref:GNAT family N-acetyltransferase n=1 Tax=Lacrimispora aerotolerans TaxID=36832 RepID=UPI00047A75AD|nr:GNAT family N-acetyltransferase [Lacrimispora aerotolerans]